MHSSDALRMNKVRFVELVVLIGLLGAGLYAAINPGKSAPAVAKPAVIVDATFSQLASELTANAIAFKRKYGGKEFRLTDTVVSINADPPNVIFAGGGQDPYDALFEPASTSKLAKLSRGDVVTFTCSSMDMASQIADCRVGDR